MIEAAGTASNMAGINLRQFIRGWNAFSTLRFERNPDCSLGEINCAPILHVSVAKVLQASQTLVIICVAQCSAERTGKVNLLQLVHKSKPPTYLSDPFASKNLLSLCGKFTFQLHGAIHCTRRPQLPTNLRSFSCETLH